MSSLLQLLEQELQRQRNSKVASYYPDAGPLRRELYPKHMEFFRAGADHRERAMIAANRIGKSEGVGGYETTLHLTGLYPSWWEGRRFDHPIQAWGAGDTNRTTRDIMQRILLGPTGAFGTGLIPFDMLLRHTTKVGIADAVETVFVRHVSGGTSELSFKSYDSGRDQFQGTNRHVIWLDEESSREIYVECLLRTMNVDGIVLATFTPLLGMSRLCRDFLKPEDESTKYTVQATWDDVPHLTEQSKRELLASIPEYQREARSKGVPILGAGAIYPVAEDDFVIDPFQLPDHYPRCYGLDVGWKRTAAVWMAVDRETQTHYLYNEYYRGLAEPAVHTAGILAVGKWIPGVIDPASCGSSQIDGRSLIGEYRRNGLKLIEADNAVEAGIYRVWNLLSTGKLRVFRGLQNWLSEYRMYQRDEEGKVKKAYDHLMDATRYCVMSGPAVMRVKPSMEANGEVNQWGWNTNPEYRWMQ